MAGNSPAKQSSVQSIPYFCPNCGAQVGEFVPVDNEVKLDAAGWLITDGEKHCHRCGRLIHFKAPRDPWPVLVARYLERVQLCQAAKATS